MKTLINTEKIFPNNSLGEGLYTCNNFTAWVDINNCIVSVYTKNNSYYEYILDCIPSSVLGSKGNIILVCCDIGIIKLDVLCGAISFYIEFDGCYFNDNYRSNDACITNQGFFIIGFMHKLNPEKNKGGFFILDKNNKLLFKENDINIPNSFIEIKDGFLISDSSNKIVWKYKFCKDFSSVNRGIFYIEEDEMYPDGGCKLKNDNILISFWDGGCIKCLSPEGAVIDVIDLPVSRPTNCKYNAQDNTLWITSSLNRINKEDIFLSGKTLFIKDFI